METGGADGAAWRSAVARLLHHRLSRHERVSHRCSNMYEDDFTDLPGKSNDGAQREDTDHSRVKKVHEKIDGERVFAVL